MQAILFPPSPEMGGGGGGLLAMFFLVVPGNNVWMAEETLGVVGFLTPVRLSAGHG